MIFADITNDVFVALITGVTTVLVVTLPIMLQNRHTHDTVQDTQQKVAEVAERLNGVEEHETVTLAELRDEIRALRDLPPQS